MPGLPGDSLWSKTHKKHRMDLSNQGGGPIYGNGTSTSTASPPSLLWIIAPLIIVLFAGAFIGILYKVVTRCRRQKAGEDAELGATRGLATAETLEVGDAMIIGDRPHTTITTGADPSQQQQPADRWGWVFGPIAATASASNINIDNSSGVAHGVTHSVEGLNELGEAPPPYGESSERTKSCYIAEMDGAQNVGAGPSCATEPEPPAYEVTTDPGEVPSIQEPPPAVTAQPR